MIRATVFGFGVRFNTTRVATFRILSAKDNLADPSQLQAGDAQRVPG